MDESALESRRIEYDRLCLALSQRASKALSRVGMSAVSALVKVSLSMFNFKDIVQTFHCSHVVINPVQKL